MSTFDLFSVGLGPSSSHTVGPMRAANRVADRLDGRSPETLDVTLHGSLALTCRGHGTDKAVLAGLAGAAPETADPEDVRGMNVSEPVKVRAHTIAPGRFQLVLAPRGGPPGHPNALRFTGRDAMGRTLVDATFRSIGGGFITEDGHPDVPGAPAPLPFDSAVDLLRLAENRGGIAAVVEANERAWREPTEVDAGVRRLASEMEACIERGLSAEGDLPGGLRVRRRAGLLHARLRSAPRSQATEIEWLSTWAMAVNEENAAGGRVVTAPTNGAAGILPAVLRHATIVEGLTREDAARMLFTAAGVGSLIKSGASISGAEMGCQGEVGSASAMAAAALAEALGATPRQVLDAAEIALEHHLGLTCDPVGGLVQIPCIERNAMGAVKALTAARLALHGEGRDVVSLDQAIDALRRTGRDMREEYKETARGGLAVSVPAC